MPMARLDVLSVGDAATDVFIRLSDRHVRVWEDDDGHWMDLPFGGKVPFEFARTVEAGGNAPNAAVGFSASGWPRQLRPTSGTTRPAVTWRRLCTARALTPIS